MHSATTVADRETLRVTSLPSLNAAVLARVVDVFAAALRLSSEVQAVSPSRQRDVALAWLGEQQRFS